MNRKGEYFDTFGRYPTVRFSKYLYDNCVDWIWNERHIKSVIGKFCGRYCVFYCLYRSRELNVRRVTRMFTKDTSLNDSIIHNFVCTNQYFIQ